MPTQNVGILFPYPGQGLRKPAPNLLSSASSRFPVRNGGSDHSGCCSDFGDIHAGSVV